MPRANDSGASNGTLSPAEQAALLASWKAAQVQIAAKGKPVAGPVF